MQEIERVWRALRAFEKGQADFADHLIAQVNVNEGCDTTWTFDEKAAESPLLRLIRQ